jgi:energy-coupling factor transport system ATP-binding protein
MQFPEYQLFEETVYKDIAFGPKNMGISGDELDFRVQNAAKIVGLSEDILEKSPFELSGGQKRKTAVAGVLAMNPKILLLDEPAAGLDPLSSSNMLDKIHEIHEKTGITVIFISHSMEDIAKYCERAIVINHGKVALDADLKSIFSKSEFLETINLSVPQITRVTDKLRKLGFDIPPGIYTVDQAIQEILKKYRFKTKIN